MIGKRMNPVTKSILSIGAVALFALIISIGLKPCGWFDIVLSRSGCFQTINHYSVDDLAFSPDGDILATLSFDRTLLWNIDDEAPTSRVLMLENHNTHLVQRKRQLGLINVFFMPDNNTVAIASGSGVEMRSISDQTLSNTFEGVKGYTVALSPDGTLLASGGSNGVIQLWQIRNNRVELVYVLEGHTKWINSLAFAPDKMILASGSADGTIRLWNSHSGRLLHTLRGHSSDVQSIVFSPDGAILASGAWDNSIKLWRVGNGTLIDTLKSDTGYGLILSMAFSPDGTTLVSGEEDGTLKLWRTKDGVLLREVKLGFWGGMVWDVTYSPDGTMLAAAQGRGPVRLFDVQQLLNNSPIN